MLGRAIRRWMLVATAMPLFVIPVDAKVTCADDKMCIETIRTGNKTEFFAINKRPRLPLSGKINLTLENMIVVDGKNAPFVLKGGERRQLFALRPRKKGKAWKWNYKFRWARGDFNAEHNDGHRYLLPYKKGKAHLVTQSCNGAFTHKGGSRFALDFEMQVGTPIYAARGGLVVEMREDSNRGGPTKNFKDDSNKIYLQHDDGTLALYYHLKKNGAAVEIGDNVKAGDLIGHSGNTGWSKGPHLHFEVTKAAKNVESGESIRVTFQTRNGPVKCPKRGQRPTAL